jgi:multidrug efflux pump subunit AcrA (membrane-fusion protein)
MRAEAQVRSAWIRWDDRGGAALPIGMRAEARIHLPVRKVAARVPRGSVLLRDGQALVEVPRYWVTADRRPVELGAADDAWVEIHGLPAGATIAVSP